MPASKPARTHRFTRGIPANGQGYDPDKDPRIQRHLRAVARAAEKGPRAEIVDGGIEYWLNIYRDQADAKEKLRAEKLAAGGDENLFQVIAARDIGEPEPVEFSKSGVLLSRGIHRISGPPGGGKTRLGYWDVLQRVRSGERWAVFDKEMGPPRYKQAMMQLGATADDLDRIDYIDTPDSVTPDLIRHGRALIRSEVARGCTGILYDSQTPFLAACGISENDPQGVRDWTVSACSGIECAIILDHTGLGDDSRGRGTSDKAAGCDIDLWLKVIRPFAVGQDGRIQLGVSKDRSGTLLARSSIALDVSCPADGGMDFDPHFWGMAEDKESVSVADILAMLLLRDEFKGRDYALAGELQKAVTSSKSVKLERIAEAVENGSIIEKTVGKSKRYHVPD